MSCVKGGSWGIFELNFEVETRKAQLVNDIYAKIFLNISLGIS